MAKTISYQLIFGVLIVLIVILFGINYTLQPYQYQGSLIDPPVPAADFSLETAGGKPFNLSDFRGKIVLLYFGYTFCPDVCPTTLYDIARAKENLGELADNVEVAMITVDPDRDSLDQLADYVTTFDPDFYGLSGSMNSLEAVWTDYGIYRGVNATSGGSGYLVDHTARVFVIDQNGDLRLTFPFGMDWKAISADLENLIKNE